MILFRVRRWFGSTSNRSFIIYPVAVAAFELGLHRGTFVFRPWGALFLLWGYLQYRLAGNYRTRTGGGGPGIKVPPDALVTNGIYGFLRNPMYLGHLVFMLGLAITFASWAAVALLAFHVVWFHRRVLEDEARLQMQFGPSYLDYKARVKRWIPGIL